MKHFIYLSILILCCTYCKSSNPKNSIEFEVNKKLLGASISDTTLGFQLEAPVGWVSYPNVNSTEDIVKHIYKDSLSEAALSITDLNVLGTHDPAQEISDNTGHLIESMKLNVLDTTNFYYEGLDIVQYTFGNDKLMLFRLKMKSSNSVLVDYIVPTENIKTHLRKVESSIGSIRVN
ncbi:hypothetical protein [Sediminitomix flava]|uniref:PsbP protein n=1 Tax=Sediminitomix flava TaxID=379075 RepID=A0A315Z8D9_SEDFL|nr:hypothetical protein [Sediminitomix flava]PWJ41846.1 hypothetical protein BC781_10396 [Sediminitomix flava]